MMTRPLRMFGGALVLFAVGPHFALAVLGAASYVLLTSAERAA